MKNESPSHLPVTAPFNKGAISSSCFNWLVTFVKRNQSVLLDHPGDDEAVKLRQ